MKKLILPALIFLCSCENGELPMPKIKVDGEKHAIIYEGLTHIETKGMPCIVYSAYKSGGVSCDWTKFEGETK